MTRCDAYWNKVREFLDNDDRASLEEFCEKEPSVVRRIVEHSEYMKRHFDLSSDVQSYTLDQKSKLSESATRPLRTLERINPVLHDEVLAEVLELEKPTAPAIAKLVAQHIEAPTFTPKLYDIWSFGFRDPRYGQEGYKWGLICGQIVENLLYYYTKEQDLVLDPMAGGGTTIDVCNTWNRRCLAFDIEPVCEGIEKNDITQGLPELVQDVQLGILEPPYYNMMHDAYKSLDEYLEFLEAAIQHTAQRLKSGGYLALIIMDQVNKERQKFPIIGPSYAFLKRAGLVYEHLVSLPLATEQFQAYHVARAKEDHFMLGINRQMWIFRRPAT